jgi:hypothetical protein
VFVLAHDFSFGGGGGGIQCVVMALRLIKIRLLSSSRDQYGFGFRESLSGLNLPMLQGFDFHVAGYKSTVVPSRGAVSIGCHSPMIIPSKMFCGSF